MQEYYQYIEDVRSGKIRASIFIKQQVERLEAFKKRDDMYFDEAEVQRCFDFMALIKEFQGTAAGKSGALLPFQKWIIGSFIGIKWKATGLRVCRDVFLIVARKNAKTSLIAKLSLYLLICDGEKSALIGNVASSRDQARILFEAVQQYAKTIDPECELLKHYRNYIKMPSTNNELRVFSSDSTNMDGYRFSPIAIADEVHSYKDGKMIAVLRSSFGASKQSCLFQITTAGFLLEGYPCYETYKMCVEILAGVKQDDTMFPFLYMLDADDDVEDEANWVKCNPAIDVVVSRDYLRGQMLLAKNDATQRGAILTKNFNMWQQSTQIWIPQTDIAKCMKKINLEDYAGAQGVLGMDLGSVSDFSSISLLIPWEGKKIYKTWTFLPEETFKSHENRELYKRFKDEGSMIVTSGNVQDYDWIINKIVEINKIIPLQAIYTDMWNASSVMTKLGEIGFNVLPFSQSIGNFNSPTKQMEIDIKSQNAIIDKSSNILWQFGNVVLKIDHNGNCLSLDTDVPTPEGMKKIKDINVGDYVFSYDGKPTRVISTTDINHDRDCYRLTFKNGAEVIADYTHQWYVNVAKKKDGKRYWGMDYRSTEWLYKHQSGRYTIMNGAVEYPEKDYAIDPYILGLWLGDGTAKSATFTVATGDTEMYDYVASIYGEPSVHFDKREGKGYEYLTFTGKTLYRQLVDLNLLGNKHIPQEYFQGSVEQRLKLVQGLMDTDGSCSRKNGECYFSQKRKEIIDGLASLLDSLGIRHSKVTEFMIKGKTYYRMTWHTNVPMFRLKRKLDIQKSLPASPLVLHNPIVKIEKVESVPTRCITVEDEKHLFLVTEKYLVSGNCKPDKSAWKNKIDSVISMCTALGGILKNSVDNDFSIYIL